MPEVEEISHTHPLEKGGRVEISPDRPKVLLLGNFLAEFLFTDERGLLDISLSLLESKRDSEIPEVNPAKFDLVVMSLTLRDILLEASGLPIGHSDLVLAGLNDDLQTETLLTACADEVAFLLDRLHQKIPELPVFITSILAPSFNFMGDLVGRNDLTEPRNFIRALNERIYNILASYNNFYFVDMNEIITFVGGQHIRDDRFNCMSYASFLYNGQWLPFDEPFLHLTPQENEDRQSWFRDTARFRIKFWSKILAMLKIVRQEKQIKMIIVGLDNTLWHGIAAEDNMRPSQRIEGWPLFVVEALIYFRSRGGLLAICSKNDREPTLARMAAIWSGAIQPKDFASIRINWQPKPENIAEILAETMMSPENTLFLDGNPREVDEVQTRLLGINCLEHIQHKWRPIILQDARFQIPVLNNKSMGETELGQDFVENANISHIIPREEWLQSLGMHLEIYIISDPRHEEFSRILTLINRTNQFNTTGKHWESDEFIDFFVNGGTCIATTVKDKTANNGIVGAALVMGEEIIQTVLSAHVLGLSVEIALGSIATVIALQRSGTARAKWIDTGKNFICQDFFDKIGFDNRGDTYEGRKACDVPPWFTLGYWMEAENTRGITIV